MRTSDLALASTAQSWPNSCLFIFLFVSVCLLFISCWKLFVVFNKAVCCAFSLLPSRLYWLLTQPVCDVGRMESHYPIYRFCYVAKLDLSYSTCLATLQNEIVLAELQGLYGFVSTCGDWFDLYDINQTSSERSISMTLTHPVRISRMLNLYEIKAPFYQRLSSQSLWHQPTLLT